MKKHDLEHIIQTKLQGSKTPPPPPAWDAIQKGIGKPWYLKGSFLSASSVLTLALVSSIIWFSKEEPTTELQEPTIESIVIDSVSKVLVPDEAIETPMEKPEALEEPEPVILDKTVEKTPEQIEEKTVTSPTVVDTTNLVEEKSEPKEPKIIRIIETDTVVTQEHIYY